MQALSLYCRNKKACIMKNRIATIARYTVLEAVRTRLPLLTLVTVGIFFTASFFVREIAIAESVRFQIAFYAATVRLAIVFIAALYAIASVAREFQDKGLDVALALDLPRSHYIVGKLGGFMAIGVGLATAASLPLIALSGWEVVTIWGISPGTRAGRGARAECLCVVTFNQLMPRQVSYRLLFVCAHHQRDSLISANPIADAYTLSHRAMHALVEGIALIVPALDEWNAPRGL